MELDFVSKQELLGIVLFFAGGWVLNLCSQWEKQRQERLRDPKVRMAHYGRRKSDLVAPSTIRGSLMTLVGVGLSIMGAIVFLMD
ncbi:MAG: hypothetical protein ACE5G9_09885 [Nitrospinales bacterium]